ncbi:MAG: V-type ATPase subunit [Sphaerochaetaceae bacterium]|nr:V-type ATPase subunit [Sphaerochaetaceae bacterium]
MSLGALGRYAFINAKLRSRIGSMLGAQDLDNLTRSQSLEELLHALKGTPYEPLLELYDKSGDIQRLEAWLFARMVSLHQEVIQLMTNKHASTIEAITRKLEVENLKSVIRLWFSNRVKQQNIDHRFGYLFHKQIVSPIDWTQIVNAENYQEIVDALHETPYGEVMSRFSIEQLTQEGLFSLETALDQTWFTLLRSIVTKLPAEDRKLMGRVLDRDTDLKNIINLVRFGWMYKLPSDKLRTLMLEGGLVTKTQEFTEYLEKPTEERSPINLVQRRFPALAKELIESDITTAEYQTLLVEKYLFKVRKKDFQVILRGNPFTIGTILAYFFLEERQNAIIRTIINGIHYGWEASAIQEYTV